jgi:NADP-dependent 3-hydroxy acid dehydrogenase YdfG
MKRRQRGLRRSAKGKTSADSALNSVDRALTGRRFIITGASSGIGAAIAACLSAAGAELIVVGRSRTRLKRVAQEGPAPIQQIVVDFERPTALAVALRKLRADSTMFDGLIHCAGSYDGAHVASTSSRDLARMMRVNVEAPIFLTLGLRERLSPESDVIFINSSVVQRVAIDAACYAATKHALRSLADSLRQEVNASGTRVVSLFPGRTATPMQEKVMREERKRYEPSELIQPSDIGSLVLTLLTLPRTIEVTEVFMRPTRAHDRGRRTSRAPRP